MTDWNWKKFFKFLFMVVIIVVVVLTVISLFAGWVIPMSWRVD